MRIDPSQHGWMTAPETVQVMAALTEGRFVGGPRRAKRDQTKRRRRHAH
jgi:hypothetical protein